MRGKESDGLVPFAAILDEFNSKKCYKITRLGPPCRLSPTEDGVRKLWDAQLATQQRDLGPGGMKLGECNGPLRGASGSRSPRDRREIASQK